MNTISTFPARIPVVAVVEPAVPAVNPEAADAPDVAEFKNNSAWFVALPADHGSDRLLDRGALATRLREGLVAGDISAATPVELHVKSADGTWTKSASSVGQLTQEDFTLRSLYTPVWTHAVAGLKWGALAGIGLKLLDTFIGLASVDGSVAMLFLLTIGVVFIPRFGLPFVIGISIMSARFTKANLFIVGLSAAVVGAILGALPGMAIGGAIGWLRRSNLPRAKDARPESTATFVKAIVLPLAGGFLIGWTYLFVFNPWLAGVLQKA